MKKLLFLIFCLIINFSSVKTEISYTEARNYIEKYYERLSNSPEEFELLKLEFDTYVKALSMLDQDIPNEFKKKIDYITFRYFACYNGCKRLSNKEELCLLNLFSCTPSMFFLNYLRDWKNEKIQCENDDFECVKYFFMNTYNCRFYYHYKERFRILEKYEKSCRSNFLKKLREDGYMPQPGYSDEFDEYEDSYMPQPGYSEFDE